MHRFASFMCFFLLACAQNFIKNVWNGGKCYVQIYMCISHIFSKKWLAALFARSMYTTVQPVAFVVGKCCWDLLRQMFTWCLHNYTRGKPKNDKFVSFFIVEIDLSAWYFPSHCHSTISFVFMYGVECTLLQLVAELEEWQYLKSC